LGKTTCHKVVSLTNGSKPLARVAQTSTTSGCRQDRIKSGVTGVENRQRTTIAKRDFTMSQTPSVKPILIGYDGTEAADRAVQFTANRAAAEGCPVHVIYVLEWSPYSFLSAQELEERHQRRTEELSRAEATLAPALRVFTDRNIPMTYEVRYGHSGELICQIAKEKKATQIVLGRKGGTALGARLLGSLALTLVQASPVPVTVVP
jgi:nucleotide-binding universal stress UspA family protein